MLPVAATKKKLAHEPCIASLQVPRKSCPTGQTTHRLVGGAAPGHSRAVVADVHLDDLVVQRVSVALQAGGRDRGTVEQTDRAVKGHLMASLCAGRQ